jgi:ammonium transporter, Amt family
VGTYNGGDVAFIILAGILVLFMVPGLSACLVYACSNAVELIGGGPRAQPSGFLYSGLARRKSALSLIWACSAANAVCIFQWWFWGKSHVRPVYLEFMRAELRVSRLFSCIQLHRG